MLVGEESRQEMCRASDVLSVLDRSRGRNGPAGYPQRAAVCERKLGERKLYEDVGRTF